MPQIYYSQKPEEILKGDPLDMVVSFYSQPGDTSRQQTLTYFLARYSMEGEFLGMAELGNQLSMCSMTYTDTQKMK
jgi:hypothetical protein